MKGRIVVLDQIDGRNAAAQIVDGKLVDLLVAPRALNAPAPGAIYRAIADRPLKGQGGMMLRLPDASAFLRQGRGLKPGQALLVQVTGYAEAGKAVPVNAKPLFKSRYAIVTPEAPGLNISRAIRDEEERDRLLEIANEEMADCEFGLILRSAACLADSNDVSEDIAAMRAMAETVLNQAEGSDSKLLAEGPDPHDLAWRDWPQPDQVVRGDGSFGDLGVLEMIDDMLTPLVRLSGGASYYIEPTRALVAVDVNTGGDTSPAAGLKANIAVAQDLPRQLRCRGLGGQIVIDFAPMAKKDRRQLDQALRSAFRGDAIETVLVGWTQLGNFEMQRKRERLALRGDWL